MRRRRVGQTASTRVAASSSGCYSLSLRTSKIRRDSSAKALGGSGDEEQAIVMDTNT
ncbi:hypothetical protein WOLCODRAFT_148356 [Wolfiporia cocos MD-104 SS10]|uniref:Uncharacterized protein n=1 Tax=Wolfiporia cocos (strain MD-104) TaxID=742152 RepID=A0A2H3JC88_WOLCO|nr:hypothetical protein WOLCODRAFT_148356 [Wolfiporia cocos MD-104 SS10]